MYIHQGVKASLDLFCVYELASLLDTNFNFKVLVY